jgi:hypothetical protein
MMTKKNLDLYVKSRESNALTEQTGKQLLAEYLILIRKRLESDPKLQKIVVNSTPATEARGEVIRCLSKHIKLGTLETFRSAVEQILAELDQLRTKKPSLYLVNQSTGELVLPINKDLIFTPPDYIGADGKLHKSNPTIHPGVSSSLALAMHKQAKTNKAISKSKKNKTTEQAYAHIYDPDKIIELAKEKLQIAGIEIDNDLNSNNQTIEFGREQSDGVFQSSNLHFHRIQIFSSTLVHKIIKLGFKKCAFGKLEMKHNSKQQWYTVEVRLM